MAYIFHEDELPKLVSVVPGRERTFFVNKELTDIDDMLAGVRHYAKGGASPYHYHVNCEHFYFIMEGHAIVDTPEGSREVSISDSTLPLNAVSICAGYGERHHRNVVTRSDALARLRPSIHRSNRQRHGGPCRECRTHSPRGVRTATSARPAAR